jgi:hypothetical protein
VEDKIVTARLVPGHRVASGGNGNPRFPGGTLRMQAPHFREWGLDLSVYHHGTLNVSLAPLRYRVVSPRQTFRQVKWHLTAPAEDFSFFDFHLLRKNEPPLPGLIYYPHPETKPEHFQRPDILELLLPFVPGLDYGETLNLTIPVGQLAIIS